MTSSDKWQKSSYSGSGDGNACVEIANRLTHIAMRDSKASAEATLSFPTGTFSTFVEFLKTDSNATDFNRSRG